MDLVPDVETEGFSFIWTIENFSYCLQKKGEYLSSPHFKLNLPDTYEWSLIFFPRGYKKDDCIGIFLFLYSGPFPITVKMYISIRATNGIFKRNNDKVSATFEEENVKGIKRFLNHSELYKKGAFLENDTLTLRCRICKDDPELPVTGQCYARTVIDIKQISFVWTLKNFEEFLQNVRKIMHFHPASSEKQSFNIIIFVPEGIYDARKIQVEITQNNPYKKSFLTCKLSLLDSDGNTAQSVYDEHWFETFKATRYWHFPFMPAKKILDHEKLYLVNGALSLLCEFTVSTGVKYSAIERTEYGVVEERDKACYTGFQGSWKDNLQHFFEEGKFSDVTIRTASSKEFPVHKAILCARSKVFSAMFEHDTKENQTGFVEIEDMNDDTVSKMLKFTYTDIVEDLDWQTASELYFAADKYGIVALKRECFTFLKGNLNSSNVCEVLIIADMHQDRDMKSVVQDFIMEHATEIINSEYWKTFMKDKSYLAAETMHLLCIRNLKI